MTGPPATHYAKSGDVSIAYQIVGEGPFDLVITPGWISHLDLLWEDSLYVDWVRRLGSFCRVILFDKRGTGLSDRDVGDSTLEERMDDLRAVLDAAGSERAALFGYSEGGALTMLFAATYPERVRALLLYATFARGTEAPDYPEGASQRAVLERLRHIAEHTWGQGETLAILLPAQYAIPFVREAMARFERAAVSPRAAHTHLRWLFDLDVRPIARTLRVPTLVLHRDADRVVPVVGGRWLGRNIPDARYVELPGEEHGPWMGDAAALTDEVEQFLTGSRGEVASDSILATVLFTDIVGSTERAAALGDRAWRDLLDRHHAAVRAQLSRFRGSEVNTAGDGFLATFDGPARAIRCARSIRDAVRQLGIDVRAGVHTGECERSREGMTGITVHIGARVMAQAGAGEILVSGTVKDLVVGSGLRFRERGTHALKGVPGEWSLFAAE